MTATFQSCCESPDATRDETGRQGILQRIVARARTLSRNFRHRKAIRDLAELSDEHLNDIGLRRSDLRYAMHLDLSRDPTTYLARQAASRRVKIRSRGQ